MANNFPDLWSCCANTPLRLSPRPNGSSGQAKGRGIGLNILNGMLKYFAGICCAVVMHSLPFGEGWGGVYAQQDPQYSQYMFNQLVLNPAYAGTREVFSSALAYRNQWTGMEGGPTTASLSMQTPLKKKNAGVGLEILSDKLGLKKTGAILGSYAYRFQFLKGKLSMGMRAGVYSYAFDLAKAHVKDPSDVFNPGITSSKTTGTFDFGIYYYTRVFYWGFGMTHLNRGKISEITSAGVTANQSIHFFMPMGRSFEMGSAIFNPSILIKGAGGAVPEADVNFNFLLKEKFWIGTSWRSGYGVVFLTQYLVNEKLKIGYSYDYGFNAIGKAGKGTHEIMIGYDMNVKGAKVETLRYF